MKILHCILALNSMKLFCCSFGGWEEKLLSIILSSGKLGMIFQFFNEGLGGNPCEISGKIKDERKIASMRLSKS